MHQMPPVVGSNGRRRRQPVTLDDLRAFEGVVRQHYPELRIEFKTDSFLQKALGFLLYPFNPLYMTKYTSTFAPVVYFPSREAYEENPRASFSLLAHEFVHLLDTKKHPLWFRFSYLFPQVLSPVAFGVYVLLARGQSWPLGLLLAGTLLAMLIARVSVAAFLVAIGLTLVGSCALAITTSGWASVALLVGLALLAPWPAPGRVHWERRGYAMTLACFQWMFGNVPQLLRESVCRSFTGPFYFFMSWGKASTASWAAQTVTEAATGPTKEGPYKIVWEFLQSRGLVS